MFDRILSRDGDAVEREDVTERRSSRGRARANDSIDEEPTPAASPDPSSEEDEETPAAVAPSIVRRRVVPSAAAKVYTCKRCLRKFTDLREYRTHLLRGH